MGEEDILMLERLKLGAGLVVANTEEVVLRHVSEAGEDMYGHNGR